jgi:threonine aldolase
VELLANDVRSHRAEMSPTDRRSRDSERSEPDDLWRRNAHHANEMAARLAAASKGCPASSCSEPLQDRSFFWIWDEDQNVVRWMTSFATTDNDIERFADGLREVTTFAGDR